MILNLRLSRNTVHKMQELEGLAEVASIRKALLEYCKLDTLAMVKILEKLRGMLFWL